MRRCSGKGCRRSSRVEGLGCVTGRAVRPPEDTQCPSSANRPCSQHWYVGRTWGGACECMRGGPPAPESQGRFLCVVDPKDGSSCAGSSGLICATLDPPRIPGSVPRHKFLESYLRELTQHARSSGISGCPIGRGPPAPKMFGSVWAKSERASPF